MSGIAGYLTRVYVPGDPVTMPAQGMTDTGDGLRFKTTDAARQAWDPTASVVVSDGGSPVSADAYTIDPLLGQVTFASAPVGAVTVTTDYLPLLEIIRGRACAFSAELGVVDVTTWGDEAVDREPTLFDVSGTIERLEWGLEDYDPGAGTKRRAEMLLSREWGFLECRLSGEAAYRWRFFAQLNGEQLKSSVTDVVMSTLQWTGRCPGYAAKSFAFGNPNA